MVSCFRDKAKQKQNARIFLEILILLSCSV